MGLSPGVGVKIFCGLVGSVVVDGVVPRGWGKEFRVG